MLTYFDDEVKKYHPVVEQCLNDALFNTGLDGKYAIKHHYGEQTDGIPDFVLVESKTDDRVAVIEVKKTPGDTLSPRYGAQAMKYVRSLKDKNWGKDYPLHFCVTNIEFTQFYHYRDEVSPMDVFYKEAHIKQEISTQVMQKLLCNLLSVLNDIFWTSIRKSNQ